MRNLKPHLAASLVFTLLALPVFMLGAARNSQASVIIAQQTTGALERGYRTGYSDGYQAGYHDVDQRAPRDYRNKEDYQRADRAYSPNYGTREDYRDGYQQGFESGYNAGYSRRDFDSTIPVGMTRRGNEDDSSSSNSGTVGSSNTGTVNNNTGAIYNGRSVEIPANTEMRVELLTNLSTDVSQKGDRFQARVIEPREYEGAMIDGHVSRVKRPGKIRGTSELQLTFDQIRLTDNRWTNFSAQLVEVDQTSNSGVGNVDPEGGVQGRDSTKDDVSKVGAATGIGAIIGAIAGGGKGAAIGAAIGGSIGTAGVLTSRGKDIRLERGQTLRIRTSNDTRIQ